MKQTNDVNIVVIGMGYVGLTYALFLTKKNIPVYGIEVDEEKLFKLNNSVLPFFEKGLEQELTYAVNKKLLQVYTPKSFTSLKKHKSKSTLYIVTVGTPIHSKKINLSAINNVFGFLQKYIKDGDGVMLRSTVSIGTTRQYCEGLSKKIHYAFAPERTIEGRAMEELNTLPQIIGTNDEESNLFFSKTLKNLHSELLEVSNTETAEMIKLTSNVYRDVIFGFSNEIAKTAYFKGINPKEVIDACNYKYPRCDIKSSGPVAGPCLSKDSYILLSESNSESIILSARKVNEEYCLEIISDTLKRFKVNKACIFGIAFKGQPQTSDTRDSLAIPIINFLKQNEVIVSGFDPLVFNEDFHLLDLHRETTYEEAILNNDLIIIQNNNPTFRQIDLTRIGLKLKEQTIILDFWSVVTPSNNPNFKLIQL